MARDDEYAEFVTARWARFVKAGLLLGNSPADAPAPGHVVNPGPTATQPTFGTVSRDDVFGVWVPVEVLGSPVVRANTVTRDLWWLTIHSQFVATRSPNDMCNTATADYSVGRSGAFHAARFVSTLIGCNQSPDPTAPDNIAMLKAATRVQVADHVLAFYAANGEVVGVYHREWIGLAEGLTGQWRPIRLYGEAAHPVRGRLPLLSFYGDRFVANDGVNDTSGRFSLGPDGSWATSVVSTTLVGCGQPCPRVRNPDVTREASRVQLFDGTLVFYDPEGHAIGLYRHA